jgi:hypothetical protein
MSAAQSQLVEFCLGASVGASTAASAVRMTIYDQNNNQLFTMVAYAGQPVSTGDVLLSAGNYTVRFNAATQTGSPLPTLTWSLSAQSLSNPQDPTPIDPTGSGTGSGPGITMGGTSGGSAGSLPIVNPYSNPTTSPTTTANNSSTASTGGATTTTS